MTNRPTAPFKTLNDVENYFRAHTNYERMRTFAYTRDVLDLGRVRAVLSALGNPQNATPIVHIAGTKGKDSTGALITSILKHAGYRVGAFCQPHLLRINERISINNCDVDDEALVSCMNALYPHLEDLRLENNALTFFDILTVLAIYYFSEQQVDFMVLEVGLGGRLDSTNVVTPELSVITSIDYDHMHILGNTLEKIAREKAGIIKLGVPVISGVWDSPAAWVIEKIAQQNNSELHQIVRDIELVHHADSSFSVRTPFASHENLTLNLLGEHQKANAAVAICSAQVLAQRLNLELTDRSVREGLENAVLRGRVEVISHNPTLILDVAHNPSSMRALREALLAQFPERRFSFLIGITNDKDLGDCLREITRVAHSVVFTGTGSPTGADPERLLQIALELPVSSELEFHVEPHIERAFELLRTNLRESEIGCVTGSFYLAGEVAKLWARIAK